MIMENHGIVFLNFYFNSELWILSGSPALIKQTDSIIYKHLSTYCSHSLYLQLEQKMRILIVMMMMTRMMKMVTLLEVNYNWILYYRDTLLKIFKGTPDNPIGDNVNTMFYRQAIHFTRQ